VGDTNEPWKQNRGIDAPESAMPYGKEAKTELTKIVQGKPLRILVYEEDRYGRSVGDIYCNGIFVQVFILCVHVVILLLIYKCFYFLSFSSCFSVVTKEMMLKKGLAWHYVAYDKRPELETVSTNPCCSGSFIIVQS